eukprot:2474633-Rhodomonas_salina.1
MRHGEEFTLLLPLQAPFPQNIFLPEYLANEGDWPCLVLSIGLRYRSPIRRCAPTQCRQTGSRKARGGA